MRNPDGASRISQSGRKIMNHTPTPWHLGEQTPWYIYTPGIPTHRIAETCTTPDGSLLAKEAKANAAFIVRAVNAHEALLAIAKELLEDRLSLNADNPDLTTRAEQAIAKAEGK